MTYNLTYPADVARFLRDANNYCTQRERVSLNKCRDTRSIQQNKLYWLWLTCISDHTGNEKEALHEYFKDKYLSVKKYEVAFATGCEHGIVRESTTDLDTKGMTLYLDAIQKFAQVECGIWLPRPEEQGWSEFYEKYSEFIN